MQKVIYRKSKREQKAFRHMVGPERQLGLVPSRNGTTMTAYVQQAMGSIRKSPPEASLTHLSVV